MIKRGLFATLLLIIIFGSTFGYLIFRIIQNSKSMAQFRPPPVSVSTTRVKAVDWQPNLLAVGTLKSINSVNVNSELPGQVREIFFKSGQIVKQGQLLVHIDDSLAQEMLKTSSSQLQLDKLTYERMVKLRRTRAASQSELDKAQAKYQQSLADVARAKLNIEKKHVRAPFSGKVGIRLINVGEYLQAGQAIVPLQSMDPLYVDFTLPEQELPSLYTGQPLRLAIEAFPKQSFSGSISAINSTVDPNTRTISVRATVPNEQGRLYPGVFADVKVLLPQRMNVITIPQTAIVYSLYGNSVYVVKEKGTDKKTGKAKLVVEQRFVKLGSRRGLYVSVKKGLKSGERIVTSGQLKLMPGANVVINNSVKLQ